MKKGKFVKLSKGCLKRQFQLIKKKSPKLNWMSKPRKIKPLSRRTPQPTRSYLSPKHNLRLNNLTRSNLNRFRHQIKKQKYLNVVSNHNPHLVLQFHLKMLFIIPIRALQFNNLRLKRNRSPSKRECKSRSQPKMLQILNQLR